MNPDKGVAGSYMQSRVIFCGGGWVRESDGEVEGGGE